MTFIFNFLGGLCIGVAIARTVILLQDGRLTDPDAAPDLYKILWSLILGIMIIVLGASF